MFYIEMTILNEFPFCTNDNVRFKLSNLNDYPLDDEPVSRTGPFKQSLDSF